MAKHYAITEIELRQLKEQLGFEGPHPPDDQDWHFMCADGDRVLEYVQVYEESNLAPSQRFELGSLILASLDEAYQAGREDPAETTAVERVLLSESELHRSWIEYWAKLDDAGDGWRITPFVRRVLEKISAQGASVGA